MSKLITAVNVYGANVEDRSRKEIINLIASACDCGQAYASTLYSKAKKMDLNTSAPKKPATVKKTVVATTSKSSTKVNKFDRANLKQLRKEYQAAINAVSAKFGLEAGLGSISFNADEFTVKMTVATTIEGEDKADRDQREFAANANRLGVSVDLLGKTFRSNGSTYTVTALKPSRRKYPVSGVSARGAKYKFPLSVLDGVK